MDVGARCTSYAGRAVVGHGRDDFVSHPLTRIFPSPRTGSTTTQLPLVHLPPEHAAAPAGVDHRHRAVHRLQLEHAVAGRARAGERRRDGGESTHQDDQDPPHGQGQCFLPNYALIERKVRTFRAAVPARSGGMHDLTSFGLDVLLVAAALSAALLDEQARRADLRAVGGAVPRRRRGRVGRLRRRSRSSTKDRRADRRRSR